jgi:hypothetical protein
MSTTLETSRLNGHDFLAKGKTKKPNRARKALVRTATQINNYRRYITVGAGMFIPLLALSLSHMGGARVLSPSWEERSCGLALLALCCTVLFVSLNHVSEALMDITNSSSTASWAMATSVDLTMIVTELSTTFATNEHDRWLRIAVMGCVTLGSMVLNVWSFLKHSAAK